MELFAYGEDGLTLWALKERLAEVLAAAGDRARPADCQILFRPSFGRRGGPGGAQFGEFDFILLAPERIYLGESKWDRSPPAIRDGRFVISHEQQLRHDLFKFYVGFWAFGGYLSWRDFAQQMAERLAAQGIARPIAPDASQLARNLRAVLRLIRQKYPARPAVQNILLYFHRGQGGGSFPAGAGNDFAVIPLDYSAALRDDLDGFIGIDL